jgi:hypothetical protein
VNQPAGGSNCGVGAKNGLNESWLPGKDSNLEHLELPSGRPRHTNGSLRNALSKVLEEVIEHVFHFIFSG